MSRYIPAAGITAGIEIRRDGVEITDGLLFVSDTFPDDLHVLQVAIPFSVGLYTFTTRRRGAGFPFPNFEYVSANFTKVDEIFI